MKCAWLKSTFCYKTDMIINTKIQTSCLRYISFKINLQVMQQSGLHTELDYNIHKLLSALWMNIMAEHYWDLLFPSVMFCMQHRSSHFGEWNKCGNNISFVQCVHLVPEAFLSHRIYIGDFSVSLCTGWMRRLTGPARFQLFRMRSSSPSVCQI